MRAPGGGEPSMPFGRAKMLECVASQQCTHKKSSKSEVCRMESSRLIVGISGASGAIYGLKILQVLKKVGVQTHLVITRSAQITIAHELSMSSKELCDLADVSYRIEDIGAAISSGSFKTKGMII